MRPKRELPESLTIAEFCRVFGTPYQTVKDRIQVRNFRPIEGTQYSAKDIMDAYCGLDVAKLAKLEGEAEEQQIKVARLKGELVELETVQADFSRWAHRIKSVIEREVDNEETRLKIFRAIRKPLNEDVKAQEVAE